jgi:hypothetical protein
VKAWEKVFALRDNDEAPVDRALNSDAVERLESRTGVTLPADFRDYLIRCAGPEAWTDRHVTSWWDVASVKTVTEECAEPPRNTAITVPAQWLVFADYAVWAMAWAIDCGPESAGRVTVLNGSDDRLVASTFSEFVDAYLINHMALL